MEDVDPEWGERGEDDGRRRRVVNFIHHHLMGVPRTKTQWILRTKTQWVLRAKPSLTFLADFGRRICIDRSLAPIG